MKKLLLLFAATVICNLSRAQNTYPWPSSGNIGIGSTNPLTSLYINVNQANGDGLRINNSNNSAYMTLYPVGSSGYNIPNWANSAVIESVPASTGGLVLSSYTGSINFQTNYRTNQMTILNNGNVGIGTSSPPTVGSYGVLALSGRAPSQGGYMSFQTNGNEIGAIVANSQFGFQTAANTVTQFYTGGAQTVQISAGGNLLVGKITQQNTTYKLDVAGQVRADAITVNTTGADFVFEDGYRLKKLSEVSNYIQYHKHLPEIPSAAEMQKDGTDIGEMNKKLLQKVEELTLYLIEKDKQMQLMQKDINRLKKTKKINM